MSGRLNRAEEEGNHSKTKNVPATNGGIEDKDDVSVYGELEACIKVLIKTKTGVMTLKRLAKKTGLSPDDLTGLVEDFPGFLALVVEDFPGFLALVDKEEDGGDESNESSVKKVTSVKLIPTFRLCTDFANQKRGCKGKKCGKLHLCPKHTLERKCCYGKSKDAKCPLGHRPDCEQNIRHNIEVMCEVLKFKDICRIPLDSVAQLIDYCVESDEENNDEDENSSETTTAQLISELETARKSVQSLSIELDREKVFHRESLALLKGNEIVTMSLRTELADLKRRIECALCMEAECSHVFLLCGHLACENCAQSHFSNHWTSAESNQRNSRRDLPKCPHCRQDIVMAPSRIYFN